MLGQIPVDIRVDLGVVEGLLNTQIDCSGNRLELSQQPVGILTIFFKSNTGYLDIDSSRQTKIENLTDDIGWQKGKGHRRKICVQDVPQIPDHLCCGSMGRIQGNKDVGISRANGSRGTIGQINPAVGKPYDIYLSGQLTIQMTADVLLDPIT